MYTPLLFSFLSLLYIFFIYFILLFFFCWLDEWCLYTPSECHWLHLFFFLYASHTKINLFLEIISYRIWVRIIKRIYISIDLNNFFYSPGFFIFCGQFNVRKSIISIIFDVVLSPKSLVLSGQLAPLGQLIWYYALMTSPSRDSAINQFAFFLYRKHTLGGICFVKSVVYQ